MAAKKTPTKTARPRRAPRAAAKPHAPSPSFTPEPAAPAASVPGPFPAGTLIVAVILIAGLALWCWRRSCPAPQEAPAAVATPAAPPAAAQPAVEHRQYAEAPRNAQSHRPVLALERGGKLSLRCWRDGENPAELEIFSAHNRRVRAVASDKGARGWLKLQWDGRDDAGQRVAKGTYFARPSVAGDQLLVEIKVEN